MISILGLGIVSGVLSGLLGIGGGIILVPGMIFLLNIDPHKATAVSLAVIVPTALFGAFQHYRHGNLDLTLVALLSIGAVLGVSGGVAISNTLSDSVLTKLFGCFVIISGLVILFKDQVQLEPIAPLKAGVSENSTAEPVER